MKGRLLQTHTEVVASPASIPIATTSPGAITDQTQTTAYDPYAGRRANSNRLVQAVYLVFGVVEALLLIRFFLRALAANADAGFAQVIYGITAVLVAPFSGLFGTPQIASGAALEVSTLLALVVYAAMGWLVARAAWLMFGETRSSSVATRTSKRT
jgi:hypothetical protein